MTYNPRGGCSNQECICQTPGPICARFEYYFTHYCIRCGWARADHNRPALIHKGGKPNARR